MQRIWETKLQVAWDETSPTGKLSLTGLSLLLQRAAVEHAEHLGFGFTETSKDNVSWVLFHLNLEIKRLPNWQEHVKVQTWPRAIEKMSAFREFVLLSESEEVLCNATSVWMIIDLTTRRPQKMDRFKSLEHLNTPTKAFDIPIPKLNSKCNFESIFKVTNRYSDLDMNGHTNARKYFDWLTDAIHETHPEKELKFIQINYFSECHAGDVIDLQYCKDDMRTFRGFKPANGKTAFIAQIKVK